MSPTSRLPLSCTLTGLTALLASFAFASPHADSATGVGSVLSNGQPTGAGIMRSRDPEWLAAKHSPSGRMFDLPFALPDVRKAASGWEYSGQLEVGVLGGDADEENARFRMYQDYDQGAYVNNFSLLATKPAGGYTIELTGGGAGRRDQYYGLQFGRANAWKVKMYFSETPHVFTDRFKTIWSGIGTGNLTLLTGLTPGGTASIAADNAAVAATAAKNPVTLSLTRKRGGVRVDVDLTKSWKAYVSYALEQRQGARPLGAVWGNAGGTAAMEIPEPVDYDTQDILAGVTYAEGLNAFNLRFNASLFQNNLDSVTFQEPYRITPAAGLTTVPAVGAYTQGRFDLSPDNTAHNVRAEYTRSMPDFYRSYFTAVVSAGQWRQDDNLLPYTTIPGISLANVTVQPGGAWETVGALSRRTTNGVIDTRLADLTFSINPTAALNLKAKARYHETDNNTDPFLVVNPNATYVDADPATAGAQPRALSLYGMTGVWGRLLNDASGNNVLMGANANQVGNLPIASAPYGSKQLKFGPTADYRLNKTSSVNAAVDHERIDRTNRDRDRTSEDRAKIGYVNRGLGSASLRVSYEYGRRRGSEYTTATYDEYFSSALIPMPTTAGANVTSWAARTNNAFRAFDLADRNQHGVNLRVDTPVRPNLDAGVSFQLRDNDYPDSAYGVTEHTTRSANLDLNYQPSPRQSIYGFYSFQQGRIEQATIAGGGNITIGQVTALGVVTPANAIAIAGTPGGPIFPLLNAWSAVHTDRNHVAGVGLKQEIGKASLHVDYSYTIGRTRIAYAYNIGGAINAANAPFAGERMPDLATDMNYLDASLRFPLSERLSARLVYRYQKESIRDWHYRNLEANPVVLGGGGAAALPTAVVFDGGPYDYKVNWFGVIVQIKL
jgi:hypothetical protein